jgi:hypothetical protein
LTSLDVNITMRSFGDAGTIFREFA